MISVQACINIGVVTGCLPTKGIALPFISYGGSSLVMSMATAAVLINIARHSPEPTEQESKPIKNQVHRV
jgi:cell division protein FtsW